MASGSPNAHHGMQGNNQESAAMSLDFDDEQFEEDFAAAGEIEFDEIDDDTDISVELNLLAARVQATRNLGV